MLDNSVVSKQMTFSEVLKTNLAQKSIKTQIKYSSMNNHENIDMHFKVNFNTLQSTVF